MLHYGNPLYNKPADSEIDLQAGDDDGALNGLAAKALYHTPETRSISDYVI
jgi:hypothetical protein